LSKLEEYIGELKRLQTLTSAELGADLRARLAAERAFQAGIESCTDVASHIISTFGLGRPQEQRDLFRLLGDRGYLDADFAAVMMEMVAFRNRLVHLYWDVDVERLHEYLQEDVPNLQRFKDFALQLIMSEDESAG
jgi:uncharacterized protein YutE (UPF0331/DUF86 family)